MNLIKKYIKIITISLALSLTSTNVIAANLSDAFNADKLNKIAGGQGMGYNTKMDLYQLIGIIVQIFLSVLGIIFLILMLYGGYLWMLDRGNNDSVKKAQGIIQAAVIGLIIVLMSYSISYFVMSKLGNATLK